MTTNASATLKDASGNTLTGRQVTWESSASTIAAVSGTGQVSALDVGDATIRATSETISGEAALVVIEPAVADVTIVPATLSIMRTLSQQLSAQLLTELGNPITRPISWNSSDPAVLTVSTDGVVSALAIGAAMVEAISDGVADTAEVTVEPFGFGTGTRIVGSEVPPGLYRSVNSSDAFCYWERLSGFGGSSVDRIANDLGGGPRLVTIASTDAGFASSGCAMWIEPTGPATPSPTSPFDEGVYLVGVDVDAGLWRSVPSSTGTTCYWERLSGFGGTSGDRVTNDLGRGPRLVAIAATDAGFGNSGCAQWELAVGPITTSPTEDFGEGMFIVGSDISPGTWRSNGTSGTCYWERLRGFSGESSDRITNDLGPNPRIVTIAPADAGFSSSDCGTWTKIG